MKLLICSDIHGDIECMNKILEIFNKDAYDRLVILGDILYHGPRNDLPENYAPKKVIEALNAVSDKVLAVRGNCDTEVDQMVLSFPILSDYAMLFLDGVRVYLTHGHKYSPTTPPPLQSGDVMLYGHTHVLKIEYIGDNVFINPGSITLPKESNPRTYMCYENAEFTIFDFYGNKIKQISVKR